MRLDRVHGHGQPARDLFVRQTVRGQVRDLALARRQLADLARSAATDSYELSARSCRPARGTAQLELRRCGLERAARRSALVEPALAAAQEEERAGPVEIQADRTVVGSRLLQRGGRLALIPAGQVDDRLAAPGRNETPWVLLLQRG